MVVNNPRQKRGIPPRRMLTPSGSHTEHGSNVTLANLHEDLLHVLHSRVEENSEVIWMSQSFTYMFFSHVGADRRRRAAEPVRGSAMSTGYLNSSSDRVRGKERERGRPPQGQQA